MYVMYLYTCYQRKKLRQAVCWVTGWYKGGLLLMTKMDAKKETLRADVLIYKHPDPFLTTTDDFHTYVCNTNPDQLGYHEQYSQVCG